MPQLSSGPFFSFVLLLFVVSGLTVWPSGAAAENVLQNGDFVLNEDGQSVSGWAVSGPVAGMRSSRSRGEASEALELRMKGKGLVTFSQTAAVAPSQVYRFSVWVKSDGRFVARAGQATMSYHHQGEWQQLVGLVDPGPASTLALTFQLSSLDGQSVNFALRDATLRLAQQPAAPAPRTRYDTTTLLDNAKPAATIVYPSGDPAFKQLATQVRDAIQQAAGVDLPMASDAEATEAQHPVLREEFRGQHLILLGRLGINRAMWPAYNRFLAASDGYYPGGDGYVVRTAANVYHDGFNHIILGGSSDAGVKRAVERFVEIANETKPSNKSWTLPWLLDVELDGECKTAFDQRDAMWEANILDPMLPKVEPGYGTVRRWYENAMSYYWTGRDSARRRAQAMIEPVLEDKAYTHHYIIEFMVRTWDMMDDTDVYTDDQRAAMDALIQKNFWDFQTGPDVSWMTTFSPPYNNIGLVNRHQISPWTSCMYMAEFVSGLLSPTDDLADVAAFRSSEINGFMHHLVTDRWEPTPPGGELVETLEETAVLSFRYALDHEQYQFFDSDNARRSLHLPKVDHRTGRFMRPGGQVDTHLILGKLAHYYQDGRYLSLLNELPMSVHQLGPFQGRYVNGVHRYTPGPELKEESLNSFTGVLVPEVSPHAKSKLHEYEGGLFKLPDINPDDVFDFAAFRGGFDADDDYFVVNGVNASANPGVLLGFSSRNVSWLNTGGSSLFNPPSEQYFDQHGVHVLRTDRWRGDDDGYAAVAERQWVADFRPSNDDASSVSAADFGGGVEFSLSPFMGTTWSRQILWVQSGVFIVRDTVTALSRGDYQVAITWRPAGAPAWEDGTWISRSGGSELRLTPLSQQFVTRQNVAAVLAGEADEVQLRQMASATLKSGQSVSSASVLQALSPGKEAAIEVKQLLADRVLLKPLNRKDGVTVVAWGPRDEADLQTDAAVVLLNEDRVRLVEGSTLTIAGTSVVALDKKQSTSITLDGSAAQAVQGYLQQAVDTPALASDDGSDASADGESQVLTAEDKTAEWQETWAYDGLLRAGRIDTTRNISAKVVDLGRVVELDEVRARGGHRVWAPSPLPEEIWVAEPTADNKMPALDSDGWRKLDGERQWHAGVSTANYGGATPVDQDVQFMKTGGVKARYVRAEGAPSLVYYDRQQPQSRRPLLIETADVHGDGTTSIFVKPDIWPKFIRSRWDQDDAVALIDVNGSEHFQAESTTDYQDARLLDYTGSGGKQAVLVSVDGKIDILAPDGEAVQQLNLYDMLVEYNRQEGRPNTRHPAGGLPMPYAIGTWRRGSSGTASLVVSRYGSLSFIDPQGRFEGVQMPGGYVTPAMLPEGIDFDGDGTEEQLVLSRGNLLQVHGDNTPYVTQPNGSAFYPQVYKVHRQKELAWTGAIDGSRPLAFESFEWAGTKRTVFVARDNYLGVYDGKLNKWAFGWVPLTKITGVALAESTGSKLTIVAATADGLLWRMSWNSILNDKPKFSVTALADPARRIAGTPEGRGPILIVGETGLYRMDRPGQLQKIADGAFVDAQFLPADVNGGSAVVATTQQGKVVRYDLKP